MLVAAGRDAVTGVVQVAAREATVRCSWESGRGERARRLVSSRGLRRCPEEALKVSSKGLEWRGRRGWVRCSWEGGGRTAR